MRAALRTRSASAAARSLENAKRKRGSAQPQDAKRKRGSAQPQDAKRKRGSAQPQEIDRRQSSNLRHRRRS